MKLTENEKISISSAILEAEKKTIGEIVPMIVRASDAYAGALWKVGIMSALLFAFCALLAFPHLNPIWYLSLEFPALLLGLLIGNLPAIKRAISGKKLMAEEAHQRAMELFYRHGLNRTKEGTGILIFVSLLEHHVEIVADKGISEKVDQNAWNRIVDSLVCEIKKSRLSEGLIQAINECGTLLSRHFPVQHGDINELRNDAIVEE